MLALVTVHELGTSSVPTGTKSETTGLRVLIVLGKFTRSLKQAVSPLRKVQSGPVGGEGGFV